jgi:hypothetical protein
VIDEGLRRRLVEMARRDLECRAKLLNAGEMGDFYHPEMQKVHEAHAAELERIIAGGSWPGIGTAGPDGAEAAWLIAQHAIGRPHFQRACRVLLQQAVERGEAEAWQLAYLTDRIRVFEGKPQLYGTQFDWDEAGEMSPNPIEDAAGVDARRAALGLPPLAETIAARRNEAESEPRPADLAKRRHEFEAWARSVGWRD